MSTNPVRSPDPAFWRGRRVLVTGHTGFKGTWLSLWLQVLGAEVVGLALDPPTTPSVFVATGAGDGMRSVHGDVRDGPVVDRVLGDHQPEVVLHLAAQSLVRRSYAEPLETLTTNAVGTATVLDAVRRHPCARAVVCVTSDKCYENREWVWPYREGEELGGHDPYSASKACAEIVVRSFRRSYFGPDAADVPIATARAGNVIGGGDWSDDRLVPDVLRAIVAGRAPEIRSPGATRPWQHVLEPVSGYLVLAESLWTQRHEVAEAWNFGPAEDDARPVSWIVERVTSLWGADVSWQRQPGAHPHESTFLRLDASRAKALLGWRPRLAVADALAWVVEWHRAYEGGDDVRAASEAQIARYASLPGRA
jgi:CDP-glucose 4,6-dehydratase